MIIIINYEFILIRKMEAIESEENNIHKQLLSEPNVMAEVKQKTLSIKKSNSSVVKKEIEVSPNDKM